MNNSYVWISISVIAVVTAVTRFLPFLVWNGKNTPVIIQKLGQMLPSAIMGMLVVYCLKNVSFISAAEFVPEVVSCVVVVLFHIWKRNTLLSIISGTLCYMIMVQSIFN